MRSTSKMIHHQFSQLDDSNEPDFIWYGINHSRPELYNLMEMLEDISSSFTVFPISPSTAKIPETRPGLDYISPKTRYYAQTP
jgi:hypothetical protein